MRLDSMTMAAELDAMAITAVIGEESNPHGMNPPRWRDRRAVTEYEQCVRSAGGSRFLRQNSGGLVSENSRCWRKFSSPNASTIAD